MIPNWLNVSPLQGSGNGTITNSAAAHTGRLARTTLVTVTGVGVETPATYRVSQTPKAEFVEFTDGVEMSAPEEGGTLTITGVTNSQSLTFAWVGDPYGVALPASYLANGATTGNGEAITGDPGAVSEFPFSIELSIPENETILEVVRTLKVTATGGQSVQIAIKQAKGDAVLIVTPTEVIIPQEGGSASVSVESNTTWSVS